MAIFILHVISAKAARSAIYRKIGHALQRHHLFAGQPRHAQIVVHLLGLGQQRFAAVHHQHGLAALAQVQPTRSALAVRRANDV